VSSASHHRSPTHDEVRLVVALSRTPLSGAAVLEIRKLLGGSWDWGSVDYLASRWGVEPLVCQNLTAHFADALSQATLSHVAQRQEILHSNSVSKVGQLLSLSSAFNSAGIPVLIVKGPAVAISAYGAYSRRDFVDIDIVVRRNDLGAASQLLRDNGFGPEYPAAAGSRLIHGGHALEFGGERGHVELHWTLMPRHLHFDLDIDEVWRDAIPMPGLGPLTLQMNAARSFLYLCAHGAKHEWEPLRWITDIAQIAQHMSAAEAGETEALAVRHHGHRVLSLGLRMIRSVFPDDPSPFSESAYGVETETRKLVAFALQKQRSEKREEMLPRWLVKVHPYVASLAYWIQSRERLVDRIACLGDVVFGAGSPEPGNGILPRAMHPFRIVARLVARAR
jgi:hypothetical protein